jgi:hypothetical protein
VAGSKEDVDCSSCGGYRKTGESELLRRIEQAQREQGEELDLSGLYLLSLPKTLSQLTQLKSLKLGYNKIYDQTNR